MKRICIAMTICLLSLGALTSPTQANTKPPQIITTAPVAFFREIPENGEAQEFMVKLRITLSEGGSVTDIQVIESSGNDDFDQAAVNSVQHWTFQPASHNGKRVASNIMLPIIFKERQESPSVEDRQP